MTQPQFISDQGRWEEVARQLSESAELAIDTEANSMYAYRGRICLIQIASAESVYLLDPLAVADLSSLGGILADPAITKVMHGSDYDLRSFHREYGFAVNGLFDTETSARFLGMLSPNLAAVLQHFLDVEIPKSRRLQRSNWGLRPLSGEAITYAAADVQHLISLAHKQRLLLQELGRLAWVEEEFVRLEATGQAAAELPAPDFLRVKGSDRLNPQQLAVLKELFDLRGGRSRAHRPAALPGNGQRRTVAPGTKPLHAPGPRSRPVAPFGTAAGRENEGGNPAGSSRTRNPAAAAAPEDTSHPGSPGPPAESEAVAIGQGRRPGSRPGLDLAGRQPGPVGARPRFVGIRGC